MLESSRQLSNSLKGGPAAAAARTPENGKSRKAPLGIDTKPPPPRPTASSSLANGTGTPAHAPSAAATAATASPPTHTISRRPSWLSNISSKFSSTPSSSSIAESHPSGTTLPPTAVADAAAAAAAATKPHSTPPGFLISTLRRLSSSTAREAFGRRGSAHAPEQCERVILNKDEHRDRCGIPGLDGNKLRKVSFCVDVEVAPCHEDVEARKEARRKRREAREKEKEKERLRQLGEDGTPEIPNCDGAGADAVTLSKETHLTETKESGGKVSDAPIVAATAVTAVDEKSDLTPTQNGANEEQSTLASLVEALAEGPPKSRRRIHPKPTTDPMKIYTQCCQLRETRILPEVGEQLLKENCPAVLQTMDLTGYRFQQADAVTFSDFLALVPIKRLILEDCDLTDEMVRMILSALAAVKPVPVLPAEGAESADEKHHRGVIERLSLKKNPRVGKDGWRYISCFVHMSYSLKALDLSRITLPRSSPTLAHHIVGRHSPPRDPLDDSTAMFSRALGQRLCRRGLEELVMGYCCLSSEQLTCILEGVVQGGTKRLGLEGNSLTDDCLAMIGRWMKGVGVGGMGICEALDLSSNSVQDHIDILSASINELSPLCALSLSNCNLSPESLSSLLPALATLPHFRWLDLSNNPLLFSSQPDCLTLLRRFLPRMMALRKVDLSNTSMTSDHAIALCEVLPEIKQLAFFKIIENPLVQSGHTKGSIEEGAAVYTALVAAAKVSKTLVRVDVDDPGPDAGDVIHALSKRLLAYCLRNMEAGATEEDWTVGTAAVSRRGSELRYVHPDLSARISDLEEDRANYGYDEDGVWQDEESCVVGGTGVVKALGVCLGNKPQSIGGATLNRSNTNSTIGSFYGDESSGGQEKANEMSKALLMRARSIKARIQPALQKTYSGELEERHYRRLVFLDETLYRVIHRFEEEYPECRQLTLPAIVEPPQPPPRRTKRSAAGNIQLTTTPSDQTEDQDDDSPSSLCTTNILKVPSRRGSEVSLHSKYLQDEEAQMHKLGQYMRHEIFAETTTGSTQEEVAVADEDEEGEGEESRERRQRIMRAVEGLNGEELKRRIMEEEGGVETYISRIQGGKAKRRGRERERGGLNGVVVGGGHRR